MTRDEIISMAREAGASFETAESMFRFAALVAAQEREACVKVCDNQRGTVSMFATSKEARAHNNAITCCAAAIHARGDA